MGLGGIEFVYIQ